MLSVAHLRRHKIIFRCAVKREFASLLSCWGNVSVCVYFLLLFFFSFISILNGKIPAFLIQSPQVSIYIISLLNRLFLCFQLKQFSMHFVKFKCAKNIKWIDGPCFTKMCKSAIKWSQWKWLRLYHVAIYDLDKMV